MRHHGTWLEDRDRPRSSFCARAPVDRGSRPITAGVDWSPRTRPRLMLPLFVNRRVNIYDDAVAAVKLFPLIPTAKRAAIGRGRTSGFVLALFRTESGCERAGVLWVHLVDGSRFLIKNVSVCLSFLLALVSTVLTGTAGLETRLLIIRTVMILRELSDQSVMRHPLTVIRTAALA